MIDSNSKPGISRGVHLLETETVQPDASDITPQIASNSFGPQLYEHLSQDSARMILIVLFAFGVLVRLVQYASHRSLWLDEAMISLHFLHHTASELLLRPLENHQGAPLAFLLVERLAVLTLGPSEYSLRLFPLVAGLLSIFVFHAVARKWLGQKSALVALFFFVISSSLIYYSSMAKQYSTDVMVALLLYAAVSVLDPRVSFADAVLLGLAGAAGVWFSHPAIFVFTGICATLFVSSLLARNRTAALNTILAFFLGLASFASVYWLSLKPLIADRDLRIEHSENFAPFLLSGHAITWYYQKLVGLFEGPVGLGASALATFVFVVGTIAMYRNSRTRTCFLLLPVMMALGASGLHRYPFADRFLLFATPGLLLVLSEGLEQLDRVLRPSFAAAGIVLLFLLSFRPLTHSVRILFHPFTVEEIRPVLEYVEAHQQTGDVIYVYYGAQPAFDYYCEASRFHAAGPVFNGREGRGHWLIFEEDVMRLRGKGRTWVIFSHNWTDDGADEEKLLSYDLDAIGHRIDSFQEPGAAAYLYDLRDASPAR